MKSNKISEGHYRVAHKSRSFIVIRVDVFSEGAIPNNHQWHLFEEKVYENDYWNTFRTKAQCIEAIRKTA